ncbi:MAG TPA: YbhB/YbcL family Raf kinase inhibitor-like protein [Verrucomicrobiae bacterium]|nr:YbhB/YbcL family Raf kinase inhibitor-like protein [Verrucomicrobiae bacterium]
MNARMVLFAAAGFAGWLVAGGGGPAWAKETTMSMTLTSPAFAEGQAIPKKYSGQGENISPPLNWSGAPAGVKSFALIVEDPDAPMGTFTHWVIFNLPPDTTVLQANVPTSETLADGARQGENDFGRTGYGGPMPPGGNPHRYYFKIFALDTLLDLEPGASEKQLLKAVREHVLAEGQLMGTYQRQ